MRRKIIAFPGIKGRLFLIIALCTCYVLITPARTYVRIRVMYTLRSNNCALGLKSQLAIITCSHLKPVLRYEIVHVLQQPGDTLIYVVTCM